MSAKPESRLVKAALDYLALRGWLATRVNSGKMFGSYKGKAWVFQGAAAGTSDILACSPHGRFAALEAKVGKNKTTKEQEAFLQDVAKRGGFAGVFWCIEDLEELVNEAEQERRL